MSDRLPLNNTSLLKELRHDILSRFLRLAKTQKNTKDEIINQEGMRMVKDGRRRLTRIANDQLENLG